MATMTTTVLARSTVTRQDQEGLVRDTRNGSEAVRQAVAELAKLECIMEKNVQAIAAADKSLADAIQEFRLEYQQYLRDVVKYAQRTRNVSRANINILASDGPRALMLIAKQNFDDSNPLAEKARKLQERAEQLKTRVLSFKDLDASWPERIGAGLAILGCCVVAIIALPFVLPTQIAIGTAAGTAIVGLLTVKWVNDMQKQIAIEGVAETAETAERLGKIEEQMKNILMAVAKGQGNAESLDALQTMFREEPDICDVLVSQVKDIYSAMIEDCNAMEKIANENYFKDAK